MSLNAHQSSDLTIEMHHIIKFLEKVCFNKKLAFIHVAFLPIKKLDTILMD